MRRVREVAPATSVGEHADERNRVRFGVSTDLASRALRVQMVGSAAIDLAWLAEGQVDASITFSNNRWDVAAGVVLAREAGARVVDLDGSDYGMHSGAVLASSPGLADEVVSVVQHAVAVARQRGRRERWARQPASPQATPPTGMQPPDRRPGRSIGR